MFQWIRSWCSGENARMRRSPAAAHVMWAAPITGALKLELSYPQNPNPAPRARCIFRASLEHIPCSRQPQSFLVPMASPSPENGGRSRNFPLEPSEFDSDPRISFSKLDDKFILETEDGQEFVYDGVIKRWVQTVWPALLALRLALALVSVFARERVYSAGPAPIPGSTN